MGKSRHRNQHISMMNKEKLGKMQAELSGE
jgi:hypothetical protein